MHQSFPSLKRLTFVGVLAVVITLLPFLACKSGLPVATEATSSPGPSGLVKTAGAATRILPHPAFAHAKETTGSVTIADVAERAAPSVVNVSSSKRVANVPVGAPFFDDPMFRRFFGPGQRSEPREREQHGMGSGVIVSSDGLVLTNNHVVDGASEIRVTTSDEREFGAKVVGTDEKSDLAVLRLEGDVQGLAPIEFGDSSRLRLGDVVLAIGNPFGVGQTITMGIVSAKGRANMGIVDYEDFIQTDAAINPGNSGGALVDMEGHLVGINTAILSRSGGYQGIGFAIPSNMAKPIMQSLVEQGKVVRGWLGVGIQDLDATLAKALGVATSKGVVVTDVMKDGPAARAGLKHGDVITKVDGRPMESTGHLRNAIAAAGARRKVEITLLRDGKEKRLSVELGELQDEATGLGAEGPPSPTKGSSLDGLSIGPLGAGARKRYDVPSSVTSGVIVLEVQPGSPAAKAGLRPGDVVVEVERHAVSTPKEFSQLRAKAGKQMLLRVVRRGRSSYLVLQR
jgi:serine protease Do